MKFKSWPTIFNELLRLVAACEKAITYYSFSSFQWLRRKLKANWYPATLFATDSKTALPSCLRIGELKLSFLEIKFRYFDNIHGSEAQPRARSSSAFSVARFDIWNWEKAKFHSDSPPSLIAVQYTTDFKFGLILKKSFFYVWRPLDGSLGLVTDFRLFLPPTSSFWRDAWRAWYNQYFPIYKPI